MKYFLVQKSDYNRKYRFSIYSESIIKCEEELLKYGYSHLSEINGELKSIFFYDKSIYDKAIEYGYYRSIYEKITPFIRNFKINEIIDYTDE